MADKYAAVREDIVKLMKKPDWDDGSLGPGGFQESASEDRGRSADGSVATALICHRRTKAINSTME